MPLTLVLTVGSDSSLLGSRSEVLKSAGYMVVSALSIREAVDRFQDGDFDLIILCHSIPTKDRERLIGLIRALGSLTLIVCIAKTSGQQDAFQTATLNENDTKEFLADLREISGRGWSHTGADQSDACEGLIINDGDQAEKTGSVVEERSIVPTVNNSMCSDPASTTATSTFTLTEN
jgi:CheY-like chemotaxis protein